MNGHRAFRTLRLVLFGLTACVLPLGLTRPAAAQGQAIADVEIYDVTSEFCDPFNGDDCEVESVAAMLPSTDNAELDVYLETAVTFDLLDYGYEAYEKGYLWQDGKLVSNGESGPGYDVAVEVPYQPLSIDSIYILETDSYLYDEYSGDIQFVGDEEYGSAIVGMSSGIPHVTSVTPRSAYAGTTGTLQIEGHDLVDPFTLAPFSADLSPPTNAGQGITTQVLEAAPDGTRLALAYRVAQDATRGTWGVTIANRFGIGVFTNAFAVGDPPPSVISVSPPTWNAGETTPVTLGGQGFGSNPTIDLSGGVIDGYTITSASDTRIAFNVTVDASDPGSTVTITVTAHGYGGFPWTPVDPGESPTSSTTATTVPMAAPPPTIMLGPNSTNGSGICSSGVNISGSKNVPPRYAGQQIAFTGCVPSSVASMVTSESWTPSAPDSGVAVAGFSVGPKTGDPATSYKEAMTQVSATTCRSDRSYCDFAPFYVVTPGNYTFTFSYTLNNNSQQTGSASVTFNVTGPSGNDLVAVTPGTVNVVPPGQLNDDGSSTTVPWLKLGDTRSDALKVGMKFDGKADALANFGGAYLWVQTLDFAQKRLTNPSTPDQVVVSSLDNCYPYAENRASTNDSPGLGLNDADGEAAEDFSATMYLLWRPPVAAGCSGDACIVPVPLGFVNWGFSGDAINTLQTQTNTGTQWALGSCSGLEPEKPAFQAGSSSRSYPHWTQVFTNIK